MTLENHRDGVGTKKRPFSKPLKGPGAWLIIGEMHKCLLVM